MMLNINGIEINRSLTNLSYKKIGTKYFECLSEYNETDNGIHNIIVPGLLYYIDEIKDSSITSLESSLSQEKIILSNILDKFISYILDNNTILNFIELKGIITIMEYMNFDEDYFPEFTIDMLKTNKPILNTLPEDRLLFIDAICNQDIRNKCCDYLSSAYSYRYGILGYSPDCIHFFTDMGVYCSNQGYFNWAESECSSDSNEDKNPKYYNTKTENIHIDSIFPGFTTRMKEVLNKLAKYVDLESVSYITGGSVLYALIGLDYSDIDVCDNGLIFVKNSCKSAQYDNVTKYTFDDGFELDVLQDQSGKYDFHMTGFKYKLRYALLSGTKYGYESAIMKTCELSCTDIFIQII